MNTRYGVEDLEVDETALHLESRIGLERRNAAAISTIFVNSTDIVVDGVKWSQNRDRMPCRPG